MCRGIKGRRQYSEGNQNKQRPEKGTDWICFRNWKRSMGPEGSGQRLGGREGVLPCRVQRTVGASCLCFGPGVSSSCQATRRQGRTFTSTVSHPRGQGVNAFILQFSWIFNQEVQGDTDFQLSGTTGPESDTRCWDPTRESPSGGRPGHCSEAKGTWADHSHDQLHHHRSVPVHSFCLQNNLSNTRKQQNSYLHFYSSHPLTFT